MDKLISLLGTNTDNDPIKNIFNSSNKLHSTKNINTSYKSTQPINNINYTQYNPIQSIKNIFDTPNIPFQSIKNIFNISYKPHQSTHSINNESYEPSQPIKNIFNKTYKSSSQSIKNIFNNSYKPSSQPIKNIFNNSSKPTQISSSITSAEVISAFNSGDVSDANNIYYDVSSPTGIISSKSHSSSISITPADVISAIKSGDVVENTNDVYYDISSPTGISITTQEKLSIFRDNMIKEYKNNPDVKNISDNKVILDVTTKVKEIIPSINKATLTIYGNDLLKISYEESQQPFPEKSTAEIVANWLNGIEEKKQKSPDGLYALVKYPCKLKINGGLPSTYSIKWQGYKPKMITGGYKTHDRVIYSIAHDPINKRIIVGLWLYKPNGYSGGSITVKIGDVTKNIGWGITEIKYKCKGQQTFEIYSNHKEFPRHYTYAITTINGNDKETKIHSISKPKDWFGFMLDSNKIIGKADYILKEATQSIPKYLLNNYDLLKSTAMYAIPVNIGFHGLNITSASQQDIKYAKKIWGYDVIKILGKNKYHGSQEYFWVGLWSSNQSTHQCSKQEFRTIYLQNIKDTALKWNGNYTPVFDVTQTVNQIVPNTKSAYLTIFTENLDKITISLPMDSQPPKLSPGEILANWKKGIDKVSVKCPKSKKWHWVTYPCKLDLKLNQHTNNKTNNNTPTNNNIVDNNPIDNSISKNIYDSIENNSIYIIAGILLLLIIILIIKK